MKAGDTLGPYHILDKLGEGGMGEVYRATDTNLKRQVAIKVLPEAVASVSERLARFQREAEVLAALNHPNIAQIYGLEKSDPPSPGSGGQAGTIALVMELVEGPTLADRIAEGSGLGKGAGLSALGSGTGVQGVGLPVDEALAIARQIAEALEAAHEQGIVHRDLKPANIKVRPDGTVKVLDFGLAKALAPDPTRAAAGGLSQSPTITTPAATMQGVILGTASYMSPEQAKGLPVDRRADVFAFGAVLYEMLTGCPAFEGELAAEVLASVINREPDYSRLSAEMSPRVGNLLRRCLEKVARNRWQAVGDIRYELDQIRAEGSGPPPASRTGQLKRPSSLVWAALIAVAMLGTWAATWSWTRAGQRDSAPAWAAGAVRLTISPPGDTVIDSSRGYSFAVSPDGDRLVFAAIDRDGTRRLWIRSLRADAAQPIAGSAGAWSPFWSADGAWIGFYANRSLRRVRPAGGEPETITGLHVGRDFDMGLSAWSSRGAIVADGGNKNGLIRIVPQIGAVSPMTDPRDTGLDDSPSFLSDGNRFLYLGRTGGQRSHYSVLLRSLDGIEPRLLMTPESWARFEYVPGYILFVRNHTLFARPFDEEEATFTGPEARVIDGVPMSPGVTPFSASRNGVLAYWQNVVGYDTVFRWVDRRGNTTPLVEQPGRYSGFALSPDGARIVMSRMTREGPRDIWLRDLVRTSEEKRTFDGDSLTPIWASDGGRIAFSSSRGGPPHVFVRALNGTEDEPVTPVGQLQFARSLHGNDLVYEEVDDDGWSDLWVAHLMEGKAERLSIDTPFNESYGRISGDGRRLAYVTDSSGQDEVRLAPFPSLSHSVPVSVGGGSSPEWRADGRELYYVSSDRQLMRVAIAGDQDDIQVGTPEVLFRFEGVVDTYDRDSQFYMPSPDGQRFLVTMRADVAQPPIRVILNWPALLEE